MDWKNETLSVGTTRYFTGDHRFLVDYLGEELFEDLEPDVAAFLLDASCLDRISGPLCDDLLERSRSANLIAWICQQNLLVIPLDDRREWYRFHHLMTEFLQSELDRRDRRGAPRYTVGPASGSKPAPTPRVRSAMPSAAATSIAPSHWSCSGSDTSPPPACRRPSNAGWRSLRPMSSSPGRA